MTFTIEKDQFANYHPPVPKVYASRYKWTEHFLKIAEVVASLSKDRNTKCGCVIITEDRDIVATGYNGFPRGINDDRGERHERPVKYLYTEHAERNAVYAAAKRGIKLQGCTAFVWSSRKLPCCADCARALIQAGVKVVIMEPPDWENENWKQSAAIGSQMFMEAGVGQGYFYKDDSTD